MWVWSLNSLRFRQQNQACNFGDLFEWFLEIDIVGNCPGPHNQNQIELHAMNCENALISVSGVRRIEKAKSRIQSVAAGERERGGNFCALQYCVKLQ